MKFKKVYSITLLFKLILVVSVCAQGNEQLKLDLANLAPGEKLEISSRSNKNYDSVLLENVFPSKKYSIQVEYSLMEVEPLSTDEFKSISTLNVEPKCVSPIDSYNKLKDLTNDDLISKLELTEDTIKVFKKQLDTELEKLKPADCDSLINKSISLQNEFIRKFDISVSYRTAEIVTIKVARDNLVWTWIFKGEKPGKWITSYGFGFSTAAFNGNTYYTKQIDESTNHQILKAPRKPLHHLNYVPAVFFSYFPNTAPYRSLNHSFTGGLGFDLEVPVILAGYNFMYNYNIGFSAGVVFQQQLKLKSQYSEGDVISLSLDSDQLHDKVFKPNIFLSVNFRFGNNPFSSNEPNLEE